MALTRDGYRPRVVDNTIRRMLRIYGAVAIEGARWCGKTWTMLNHANSVDYLGDENTRTLAEISPRNVLQGAPPHAVDEWQEVPAVWDAVRHAVDQGASKGAFLLTGSVTPPKEAVRHSGIGRIAGVRMRTMSLYESGLSTGAISLGALLRGESFEPCISAFPVDALVESACRGGWPGSLGLETEDALQIPIDYLDAVAAGAPGYRGRTVRYVPKFQALLASLARSNASTVRNTTLLDDVRAATQDFAADTLTAYLQMLRDVYVLEEIPGWAPQLRSKARILSGPKRMFADPSLAVAALKATPSMLMGDLQAFGSVFEGLCLRDLAVYAEANRAKLYHYRDGSQLEVDAVIVAEDGAWSAFEIKLNPKKAGEGAKALLALASKMASHGMRPPACLAVITGSGVAAQRADGVYTAPIALLRE